MPRRAGHAVLLLSPKTPDEMPVPGATACLLLDCADDLRTERLRASGGSDRQIEAALEDARHYRGLFDTTLMTDDLEPPTIADQVLAWTRSTPAINPKHQWSEHQDLRLEY
jgi:hypothetical protein